MARIRRRWPVVGALLVVGVFQWSLGFTPPCSIGYRGTSRVRLGLRNRSGIGLDGSTRVSEKTVKNVNHVTELSPLPLRSREVVVTGLKAEASEGERGSRLGARLVGVGSCTPQVVSVGGFRRTCLYNASVMSVFEGV